MFEINLRKVLFGEGASDEIGKKLRECGAKTVLCLCDSGIKASGISDRIVSSIEREEIRCVLDSDVTADPPAERVDEIAARGCEAGADAVIGLGGGSSLDTAKAVNLLLTNPGSVIDYISNAPRNPVKPLFLIPTTAGTGSECSNSAIITVEGKKVPLAYPCMEAALAIVDPKLTWGIPKCLTASAGMDAFCHAIEGYTSRLRSPMTDMINREGMHLAYSNLRRAVNDPDDHEARSNMCFASMLGGMSIANCILHFGHSIAHTLGSRFHVAHGAACAAAIPGVVKQMTLQGDEDILNRMKTLAGTMGIDPETGRQELADTLGDALRSLRREIGIPPISDYAGLKDLLAISGEICADVAVRQSPIPVRPDMIRALLEKEYSAH